MASAQLQSIQIQTEEVRTLPPASADAVSQVGTWWLLSDPGSAPYPCFPPGLIRLTNAVPVPVYLLSSVGDQRSYLVDDRAAVALETLLEAAQPESGLMQTMDSSLPALGEDEESGGASMIHSTNDLWLELKGVTNNTANLVIHLPWNETNGVWGLYFKTNLAIPYNWTWLLRNAPGQTNLIVTNLPAARGFFMLGPPTAIRPGFDQQSLAPNDDDCYFVSGDNGDYLTNLLAAIGFPINFFGTTYTNLYVNNNGNVTFDTLLSQYTPEPLAELVNNNFTNNFGPTNIIAPFWADVDTRGANSGVVTYGPGTVDGRIAFGVNWPNVGYFSGGDDKLNTFQLVLIDRSDRASGDFDLEFNYAQIQWEAGEASGGTNGIYQYDYIDDYDSPARAGYASANGTTFELNGSAVPHAFLDINPDTGLTNSVTGLIYHNFDSTAPGRYVFQFHNGAPGETP